MADDKTITQADIDKAIKDALAEAKAEHEAETQGLKDKNRELLGKVRQLGDIKPEDLAAAEQRAEKLENDLADAKKSITALTKERDGALKERDGAVKTLETEKATARNFARDADISAAIAAGNVVPGLVKGLTKLMQGEAVTDIVDGKYVTQIGDKPASEHIKAFLDSDDGKVYRAAPANGGGGAPGGSNSAPPAKTIKESEFSALSPKERAAKMAEGFVLAADAA